MFLQPVDRFLLRLFFRHCTLFWFLPGICFLRLIPCKTKNAVRIGDEYYDIRTEWETVSNWPLSTVTYTVTCINQERPVRQGRSFLAVCCRIINFALYYSSVRVQYRRLSISYGSSSSVYNPAVKSI